MLDELFSCWGDDSRARRARWGGGWGGGWDAFLGDFWGGPAGGPGGGRGRGRHWRAAGRVFEQGDLKLVILRLLEEKPRHGYDVIKALEERFGGAYSPSPGTVYPTLTMLEDLGYARAVPEDPAAGATGGKRIYEITDEGRQYLAENSRAVDDIFERISRFMEGLFDAPMHDVKHAFAGVARATWGTATRTPHDRERLARIAEILRTAAAQIEALAGTNPPK